MGPGYLYALGLPLLRHDSNHTFFPRRTGKEHSAYSNYFILKYIYVPSISNITVPFLWGEPRTLIKGFKKFLDQEES